MRGFRHYLLLIFFVAVGSHWMSSWSKSRAALDAPPASGPDFRRSDSDLSHPLRIIVYGDMRFTDPHETSATNPKVRRWLVNQIAAEKPDAVLLTGDVPWHGGQAGDYDEYRSETQIWRDAHLHIYPALGNHEFSGGGRASRSVLRTGGTLFRSSEAVDGIPCSSDLPFMSSTSTVIHPCCPVASRLPGCRLNSPACPRRCGLSSSTSIIRPWLTCKRIGTPAITAAPTSNLWLRSSPRRRRSRALRFVVAAGHVHNYERFFQDGIVYLVSGGGGAKPSLSCAALWIFTGIPDFRITTT